MDSRLKNAMEQWYPEKDPTEKYHDSMSNYSSYQCTPHNLTDLSCCFNK